MHLKIDAVDHVAMRIVVVASAHGAPIDDLIVWMHWLMLLLFVGWGAFFVFTLVRFRRSSNPTADYEGTKSHLNTYLEVAIVIFELFLMIFISIPVWANVVHNFPEESEAEVIRVVGEQFAWNMHYPGQDGVFGQTRINLITPFNPLGLDRNSPFGLDDVTTINQLHIPVNEAILIQLTTKDVIHGFGLPEMRVKQDAIPGMVIPVTFTATLTTDQFMQRIQGTAREGKGYEIACAQLCGLGHFRMRGFLTVQSRAEYESWLAEEYAFILEDMGEAD